MFPASGASASLIPSHSLTFMRRELISLGIDTSTPGIYGEFRRDILLSRLSEATGDPTIDPATSAATDNTASTTHDCEKLLNSNTSIAELKKRLEALGIATSTPNIRGDERRTALVKRLSGVLLTEDPNDSSLLANQKKTRRRKTNTTGKELLTKATNNVETTMISTGSSGGGNDTTTAPEVRHWEVKKEKKRKKSEYRSRVLENDKRKSHGCIHKNTAIHLATSDLHHDSGNSQSDLSLKVVTNQFPITNHTSHHKYPGEEEKREQTSPTQHDLKLQWTECHEKLETVRSSRRSAIQTRCSCGPPGTICDPLVKVATTNTLQIQSEISRITSANAAEISIASTDRSYLVENGARDFPVDELLAKLERDLLSKANKILFAETERVREEENRSKVHGINAEREIQKEIRTLELVLGGIEKATLCDDSENIAECIAAVAEETDFEDGDIVGMENLTKGDGTVSFQSRNEEITPSINRDETRERPDKGDLNGTLSSLPSGDDKIVTTKKVRWHDNAANIESNQKINESPKKHHPREEDGIIWGKKAMDSLKKGELEEAKSSFEKSLEFHPDNLVTLANYGLFQHKHLHNMDHAEELYKKCTELMFDDSNKRNGSRSDMQAAGAGCLTNYANFLRNVRSDWEGAERLHLKAIRLDPNHAGATGAYAIFLAKKDRSDLAEEMFQNALAKDGNHVRNLTAFASFLSLAGRTDEADAIFKQALEIDENDLAALCNYGNFLVKVKNDPECARALYLRGMKAHPRADLLRRNYDLLLRNNGTGSA